MPACSMGAHISAVPNHQLGRITPLKTRGNVAMAGQFGYELDLNTLTDEEIETVKEQISNYKELRETIHKGDMYRLKSPFEGMNTAWEYVYKDTVVLMYFTILIRFQVGKTCVKLSGLDADAQYILRGSNEKYSGSYLMNVGLYFENTEEFSSKILVFEKE